MLRLSALSALVLFSIGLAACQKATSGDSPSAIRKEKTPPSIHYYQISEQ